MKTLTSWLVVFFLMAPCASAQEQASATAEEEAQFLAWAQGIWDSLDRQTGEIALPEAGATLKVPENFYYLNPGDAEKVLTEVWNNPPGELTLGMLFPADMTPFDENSWAVTIEYQEDGYVSDDDAGDINYSELLSEMQKDTRLASDQRVELGYETMELVGWAAPPFYDAQAHKLHWAKEIRFGEQSPNTLNYNIRVLGRKGVLILNFIAGMDQKAIIDSQLDSVLAMAEFDPGSTYRDFDPSIDKVAAYGLGALVAGKVIAKTGFLAVALVFLKKFGVFIVLGVVALFKGLFGRKDK